MIEEVMNRREAEYKELSFDTAIRNPERYAELFAVIKKYNGVILDDENILNIMLDLYETKIITSDSYISDDLKTEQIKKDRIIDINSSRNADGGFPKGYQSRFWTYMRTPSEFGFVYARYKEAFIIGEVTNKLVNGEIDSQEAFSLQAIKYNRKSPYRNVSNDYNYFRYIVNILEKLDKQNKKMTYNQFVLSLFSKKDNVDDFVKLISENRFDSDQITYDYIKDNYPSVNKLRTVMYEYPDVVLRMLRITGFVNIQNNGIMLIELNSKNKQYINQLLNLDYTLTEEEKIYSKKYFEKLNTIEEEQISIIKSNRSESNKIYNYNSYIEKIIKDYQLNIQNITDYLTSLCNGRETSIDNRFKYITAPLKLEFFISLFMYLIYGEKYEIRPNYKIDDYGIPISHAPGNMGDIEITNENTYWLIEVTLIKNKTQQLNNETINLFRHINNEKCRYKYLSLVAPHVHTDTVGIFKAATVLEMSENGLKNFYAKPYSILEFIEVSKEKKCFSDIEEYTLDILRRIKKLFEENNI